MRIIGVKNESNKIVSEYKDIEVTRNGNIVSFKIHRKYETAYGFGEKYDHVNHIGKKVVISIRERCFYQDDFTYLTFPFMNTADGFGLFVESKNYVEFDLTEKDVINISVEIEDDIIPLIYMFEGNTKEVLTKFKKVVGNTKVFPKWIYGAWISSNRWDNQEDVEYEIKMLDETKIPHSVIVLERWSDLTTFHYWYGSNYEVKEGGQARNYSDFTFDKKGYYNPKKLVESLHERDLKVLLWDLPMYATERTVERPDAKQRFLDNEYIIENELCVMNDDGTPYLISDGNWFAGSMIPDFTKKEAREFWFKHRQHLMEIGIDGFKTDGGEFIYEKNIKFADGRTGVSMKNGYADEYVRAYDNFLGDEKVIFTRTGSYEVANHTITWAGDQESTWEEFNSILKAGLTAGLSGISNWGFDIAGFGGYLPSKALYARSIQMAALVPIMQWHSEPISNGRIDFTGAHKNNDRSPWNMATYHKDPIYLEELAKQFNLHYNLIPYFYELALEANETGTPALRHLAFEFNEKGIINLEKQYMLGSSLLVAPVLEDYLDELDVYLPNEKWYDLYTGKIIEQTGWIKVPLTEDKTPVFMRDNSVVSLNLADGLKLGSYVGNELDSYKNLTFIISGVGNHKFKDDLGNEIDFSWNEDSVIVSNNKLNTAFEVIRINELEEKLW